MSRISLYPSPFRINTGQPLGETIMMPGQLFLSKFFHTSILSSLITGCLTSYFNIASLTLLGPLSLVNLAEWQPIKAMLGSSLNLFSRNSISGSTCRQLMQQKVQKSIKTILLDNYFEKVKGPLLNHVWFYGNSFTLSYTNKLLNIKFR